MYTDQMVDNFSVGIVVLVAHLVGQAVELSDYQWAVHLTFQSSNVDISHLQSPLTD